MGADVCRQVAMNWGAAATLEPDFPRPDSVLPGQVAGVEELSR